MRERCDVIDTLTIIVDDIPTINAGSDALTCADSIQLNGSTPRNAAGNEVDIAINWEPVEDYPGVTISDPTIRNPVVRGLQPGREYTFRYAFPGSPDCEKEDIVTITVKEDCDDLEPPLKCEFELTTRCTSCGCGKDLFIAKVRNSNGDHFEPGSYEIKWFVNGEPFNGQNFDYISSHYEGPSVVTAQMVFDLGDGTICELEKSTAVTCGKDCPEVSFAYTTDDCGKDYFYGEVTVVDQAGNPITTAGIDWFADGSTETNPYQVFVPSGEAVPVTVEFYSPRRCVREVKFIPECSDAPKAGNLNGATGSSVAGEAVTVYPNPAHNDQPLIVDFGGLSPRDLTVTDLAGRKVFQRPVPKGSTTYTLTPATLPVGVFIVLMFGERGEVLSTRRFVVR